MNIWLVQIGEPLPIENGIRKMRTAIVADKLVKREHNVLWWASAFDHLMKKWIFKEDKDLTINKYLKIKAMKGIGYKRNISLARFIDHRVLAHKFRKSAPKMAKPDIIITSMPPHDLAYESVSFAKKNNIPVLVDIRDPWPDMFLNHIPSKLQEIVRLMIGNDFLMVKKVMQKANGLIAVTNTFLEWGLRYAEREKVENDRVFYLGQKKCTVVGSKEKKVEKLIKINLKRKFVVAFIGTFNSYHNPAILLDCASKLAEQDVFFVLAGDGKYFKEIKEKASSLYNVALPGWLNQVEIETLLNGSHVGVCPTAQTIDLFPNKAFTYLSAGLPVISAFQGDLKKLIESCQIGFNYSPNDVDALVDHIMKLYGDRNLYKKMSRNALKIFNDTFDAEIIYGEYVKHIENVADNVATNRSNV